MFNKQQLNKFKEIETPFYYYDIERLKSNLDAVKSSADRYGFYVHYAIKANANDRILSLINSYNFGADCVSGNEIQKSIDAGFKPDNIVFAGVGKSDKEIDLALNSNIFSFNCESLQEIEVINELASRKNKVAKIAVRVNPDVNAKTHKYITTGTRENKFGINFSDIDEVLHALENLNNVSLKGLHFHIGSQITDYKVFENLCFKANEIQDYFQRKNIKLEYLNMGGGLGVDYDNPDSLIFPDFEKFFAIFHNKLKILPNQKVHFELGRAVVAQCGSLISRVLYIKQGKHTNFVIIDAGMTELIRPALYQAYHKVENISSNEHNMQLYDVVGPICESSDTFGKLISLPTTSRGDLIAIRSTGAYGEVMSSNYNLRDSAKSCFSDDLYDN